MLQIYHENNLVKVQLSDILMLIEVHIFISSSHKRLQASVVFDTHVCFSFISVSSFLAAASPYFLFVSKSLFLIFSFS